MSLFDENLTGPLVRIVFLVVVGLAARASRLLSEGGIRSLTEVVLNVTLPPMLFMSAAQSDLDALIRQGPWVALAGIIFPLLGFAAGAGIARLFRLARRQDSVVRVSGAVCNTAFVGIPVCTALWGPVGAVLAAIYDLTMTLPILTLPALEYGGATNRRAVLRTLLLMPMLWGLLGGIAWRFTGLALPPWLGDSLNMLGSVTLPLSLVLVGALMMPAGLPTGLGKSIVAFLLARLVAAPVIALGVVMLLRSLGISGAIAGGVAAGVVVLQAGMPASVLATVFAKEYGADTALAASGALFSYLFALLTIPLLASVVTRF